MATKIVMLGALGRMGQHILHLAKEDKECEVAGEVDRDVDLKPSLEKADVVIDFTMPSATMHHLPEIVAAKKPMVLGTTGFSEEEKKKLKEAAKSIAMVFAPNMSLGVNLLFSLTQIVSQVLGDEFDVEIVEAHHNKKIDAPSGTAHRLAEIVANSKQKPLSQVAKHGRQGITDARRRSEIGIHAVRGGDVVGDHTVMFLGAGERIELIHRASSRDTFAKGALRAAKWVVSAEPGQYDMLDVLGLKVQPNHD
jgi:4-hydroxy-tetrahydrodipicolinate reductase